MGSTGQNKDHQDLLRIAITGPESTGKSELAEKLARHYHTVWVPEYAREYLNRLGRRYEYDDLLVIARGQWESEMRLAAKARTFLFCDTDFLVAKIWCGDKFGKCHPWISEMVEKHRYNLYLLCDIDLPWSDDPLRENPHDRDRLFALYRSELDNRRMPYAVISGTGEERLRRAIEGINKITGPGTY